MPYITREDGEHFVIPSYRDVLTVKQKSQLKKEILLLSKSYGEYITLQKKGAQQYEVAFSADTGYLLGESIWNNFKKPLDLIYCEAIPNTTEAILVIVKAGSVYLDGSFPLESIPEELIIFLTQQNNFEIYTYGDVPISKEPASAKFSFEAGSVKSFTVLDKPVFPKLPLLKVYQLKLVDTVLKEQGVGVLPVRQMVMVLGVIGIGWLAYAYFTAPAPPPPPPPVETVNPFQAFNDLLNSPAPDEEIAGLTKALTLLLQIPGWSITEITYIGGTLTTKVLSSGGTMAELYAWCDAYKATPSITDSGVSVSISMSNTARPVPNKIYPTQKVLALLIDRVGKVLPGNSLSLANYSRKVVFTSVDVTINMTGISLAVLDLVGKQFSGLPLVLNNMTARLNEDGSLTGSIIIDALGS